jgi:hypothetical protein
MHSKVERIEQNECWWCSNCALRIHKLFFVENSLFLAIPCSWTHLSHSHIPKNTNQNSEHFSTEQIETLSSTWNPFSSAEIKVKSSLLSWLWNTWTYHVRKHQFVTVDEQVSVLRRTYRSSAADVFYHFRYSCVSSFSTFLRKNVCITNSRNIDSLISEIIWTVSCIFLFTLKTLPKLMYNFLHTNTGK